MNAKEKILVVDDDPNLRKTLADILRVKGYETAVAGTGAEAIAAMESGDISLALIDLMLPDMPGLEVMARLKAMSPTTEVIILTGNASMDTAIEATSQGAFSYLAQALPDGRLAPEHQTWRRAPAGPGGNSPPGLISQVEPQPGDRTRLCRKSSPSSIRLPREYFPGWVPGGVTSFAAWLGGADRRPCGKAKNKGKQLWKA